MKEIAIIGTGMGPGCLTAAAKERIQNAQLLIGAERLVAPYAEGNRPVLAEYRAEEIKKHLAQSDETRIAILVSGDVGFYSGARRLLEALREYAVELIPGVSSLSYFCARLGLMWQDMRPISLHGVDANIVEHVRRSRYTFCLTGSNVQAVCQRLIDAGFSSLPVFVGENLDSAQERITKTTIIQAAGIHPAPLTVLLIENEAADARIRTGIPDTEFQRGDAPMTKSEVRAAILSRLSLRPGDVCYDIGAGTGSVAVEMALSAYEGQVYAIDRNGTALALAQKNCKQFHIGNVQFIKGEAPGAFSGLPTPDAVFIGGSGGQAKEIVAHLLGKNPHMRLVATAVAIESIAALLHAFEENHIADTEVVQLSVSRAKEAGGLHMLLANNPVFIISGGGHA